MRNVLQTLIHCCAGLDVHRSRVTVTILKTLSSGQVEKQVREFSAFRRSLQGMAQWLKAEEVELAVMESTGIYTVRDNFFIMLILKGDLMTAKETSFC